MILYAWFCTLLLAVAFPASAVENPLPNPAEETRAYALFHEIRCAVCQTDTIADSPADVAADMRYAIRRRVVLGDSDYEIKGYMAQRYGNNVLIRPPLTPATTVLWFGPLVLLIITIFVVWMSVRRESTRDKQ